MPINLKTQTDPRPTDAGLTRRVRSASWVMLVLLPIPLTLLGVLLAAVGGWLGIGLVVVLQGSMMTVLVATADHPPPLRPGMPPVAVETKPVGDEEDADAGPSSDAPEA